MNLMAGWLVIRLHVMGQYFGKQQQHRKKIEKKNRGKKANRAADDDGAALAQDVNTDEFVMQGRGASCAGRFLVGGLIKMAKIGRKNLTEYTL